MGEKSALHPASGKVAPPSFLLFLLFLPSSPRTILANKERTNLWFEIKSGHDGLHVGLELLECLVLQEFRELVDVWRLRRGDA